MIRSLDFCSDDEKMILIAIVSLASQLPKDLVQYTRALGDITKNYFPADGGRRGVHNPNPGSVTLTKDVRARKKWS